MLTCFYNYDSVKKDKNKFPNIEYDTINKQNSFFWKVGHWKENQSLGEECQARQIETFEKSMNYTFLNSLI